jgi:hypothetical protein
MDALCRWLIELYDSKLSHMMFQYPFILLALILLRNKNLLT